MGVVIPLFHSIPFHRSIPLNKDTRFILGAVSYNNIMVLLPYSFKCRFMVPFVSELATQLLEKS
jgi:hypothetical protein